MNSSFNDSNDNFAERLRFWRISQDLTQQKRPICSISTAATTRKSRAESAIPAMPCAHRFLLVEKSHSIKPGGNVGTTPYGLRNIPILSWAQAGQATDFEQIPSDWDEVVPSDVADERAFGVRLRGDSMEPNSPTATSPSCCPSTAPTNGEIVVANIRNQGRALQDHACAARQETGEALQLQPSLPRRPNIIATSSTGSSGLGDHQAIAAALISVHPTLRKPAAKPEECQRPKV